VTNDNTIPFDGHRLQIPPGPGRRSYAKAKVEVQQHLDGQLEIRYQGKSLATFQPADEQPVRVNRSFPRFLEMKHRKNKSSKKPASKPKERKPFKPAADHPWRKPLFAKKGEKIE
jgi:hypothetical protein